MATIVQLKHKNTGEILSLFSVDAKEFLAGPGGGDWGFERRLERGSKMIERNVSTGEPAGGIEISGERIEQAAVEKSISESKGGAKRGQRGGGPQEPVNAPAE
jgi:hypothetical protein